MFRLTVYPQRLAPLGAAGMREDAYREWRG
jgi:hypothetical protein